MQRLDRFVDDDGELIFLATRLDDDDDSDDTAEPFPLLLSTDRVERGCVILPSTSMSMTTTCDLFK